GLHNWISNFLNLGYSFDGLRARKPPSTLYCLRQALLPDRLEKVIDCTGFKSLQCVRVKGGHYDNHGHMLPLLQVTHNLESTHRRHLQIKKHKIRLLHGNLLQGHSSISGLADYFDVVDRL